MYNVEIPTLKSILIEIRFMEKALGIATGFLVSNTRDSHCALMTNRHVVTGRHQDTQEPLDKNCAIPNNLNIYFHKNEESIGEWVCINLPLYRSNGDPYWIEHPHLGQKVDVVALNLNWGKDVCKFPYFLNLDIDRVGMIVLPAEPVSVIGFPFGLSSRARFPVWATGFLAQELTLVDPEAPYFLIDCRTRQGQSGSAVIAYRPSGYRYLKEGKIFAQLSHSKTWEFLGIYSGRVNPDSDLGKVWTVNTIQDILNAAELDYKSRSKISPEE